MVNRWAAAFGAMLCSFVACCLYYDYKRHQDPGFKAKLKLRRAVEKAKQSLEERERLMLEMEESLRQKFNFEVALAEDLAALENFSCAMRHFVCAAENCVNGLQLFVRIRTALPVDLFHKTLAIIRVKHQRMQQYIQQIEEQEEKAKNPIHIRDGENDYYYEIDQQYRTSDAGEFIADSERYYEQLYTTKLV